MENETAQGEYFRPYDKGFVDQYGDPKLLQRERINEGGLASADKELLYEGVSPRMPCPGMVGPFSDGNFYCTARDFGYCDRRSGTCFCNVGYTGIDCNLCQAAYHKVGSLCEPKKLCPEDCSGAGQCDYSTGTCICEVHRTGEACEVQLCSKHDVLCETCTNDMCLKCSAGYYLTGDSARVCGSCYDFDPRCAGCTKEEGCTICADSTLTSVHRSGYRRSDPKLPLEEDTREHSITLPFGTKSAESFADAEGYEVVTTPDNALKNNSITCEQGLANDEFWECEPFEESHVVCGHFGVFTFLYPNYEVSEKDKEIRMGVRRSGGGYGDVSINYYIKHFTTNDSDVVSTAAYTTSQTLYFTPGVIERFFKIVILDDNIVEEDEVFQVVLEVPIGGGSVGAQFRANVTILDDDRPLLSPKLTKSQQNYTFAAAGEDVTVFIVAVTSAGAPMTMGGDSFYAVVENDLSQWAAPGSTSWTPGSARNSPHTQLGQRNAMRKACNVQDFGNGTYNITIPGGLEEQGTYQMRIYHAFPDTIKGEYYYDGFFDRLAVSRLDQMVNFTWGYGRLMPRGSDYITIRWSGAILAAQTGRHRFKVEADDNVRLWIEGVLLIDHWHEQYSNLEPSRFMNLTEGSLYEIVLEYREITGEAHARLMWAFEDGPLQVITGSSLFSLFEIDRSPVIVGITSTETAAETTECEGDGLYEGITLQKSYFSYCPRDVYRNLRNDDDEYYLSSANFEVTLNLYADLDYDGRGVTNVRTFIDYNNETHCFDVSYTPERAGGYELRVTYSHDRFGNKTDVLGSPFYPLVKPSKTSGPLSRVYGLEDPLYGIAGSCYDFTIEARDWSENLRFEGGDDFDVYMYQVNQYYMRPGRVEAQAGEPTPSPTEETTSSPSSYNYDFGIDAIANYVSDLGEPIVRSGTVFDLGTGYYTIRLCPIIAGLYETHILLNGKGVSNQHFTIQDKAASMQQALGRGQYDGQYIAQSPYALVVRHTEASIITTTAEGVGLTKAVIGIETNFVITVRDAWDNVLRDTHDLPTVKVSITQSPNATVSIHDYLNGQYHVRYVAETLGTTELAVYLDGFHIRDSPFFVPFLGSDDEDNSIRAVTSINNSEYVLGWQQDGNVWTPGEETYIIMYSVDQFGNRRNDFDDTWVLVMDTMPEMTFDPCPKAPATNDFCDASDTQLGHYFVRFVPEFIPDETQSFMEIFLENTVERRVLSEDEEIAVGAGGQEVDFNLDTKKMKTTGGGDEEEEEIEEDHNEGNSRRRLARSALGGDYNVDSSSPSYPVAKNTLVWGTLYDNVAGDLTYVYAHMRDSFGNLLTYGDIPIEMALLGVGVEWGTIEPYSPQIDQGLPNEHYYKGFYAGYPDEYSVVIDHGDGAYTFPFDATKAGMYVLRLALAENGLNATFFNTTSYGLLVDLDTNNADWKAGLDGQALNPGSTLSWTGDQAGVPGARGSLGEGSYYNKFHSRLEETINLNVNESSTTDDYLGGDSDARLANYTGNTLYKFRNEYWSARWVGMITPQHAEMYRFTIDVDTSSTAQLRIGGLGNQFNQSQPGDLIINYTAVRPEISGFYNFTNIKPREILMDYAHFESDAKLVLYWESPSTAKAAVPASAFKNWKNISHYNLTIHPAALCSICSTVYGDALNQAQVAQKMSFVVYARDWYDNLLQKGGHDLSMVAVGFDGVHFRGDVTDYGNSTYLIEYYPTTAGVYRMYVMIGPKQAHPDVGIAASLEKMQHLMVKGSPFLLDIVSSEVHPQRTVAVGPGLVGGTVGQFLSFSILLRDIHNNPTHLRAEESVTTDVQLIDQASGDILKLQSIGSDLADQTDVNISKITYTYNATRAGEYWLHVKITKRDLSYEIVGNNMVTTSTPIEHAIIGSPFSIYMSPEQADSTTTVCKGVGIRQATVERTATFEISLFDRFHNALIIGGNKFMIRLYGDAAYQRRDLAVVPDCVDSDHGKYTCRYVPIFNGTHNLVVSLLYPGMGISANPLPHPTLMPASGTVIPNRKPQGAGLYATYYASKDGALHAMQAHASGTEEDNSTGEHRQRRQPIAVQVDPTVSFRWIDGFMVPSRTLVGDRNAGSVLELQNAGQSVQWTGYIVAPRSDKFSIFTLTNQVDASVFIDGELVHSSSVPGSLQAVTMKANAAYAIRVVAFATAYADYHHHVMARSIDLQWSTPTIRPYTVPAFFLYPDATEIPFSPFPVTVHGVNGEM